MGAPLRRLAEGHSDELFASSPVGFLPFPAPLREGFRFFPNQLRVSSHLGRSCGMDAT